MDPLDTPPLTPYTPAFSPSHHPSRRTHSSASSSSSCTATSSRHHATSPRERSPHLTPLMTPTTSPDFALPPAMYGYAEHDAEPMSALDLGEPSLELGYRGIDDVLSKSGESGLRREVYSGITKEVRFDLPSPAPSDPECSSTPAHAHAWRPDLSPSQRDAREHYLSAARGRPGLRIVIVTENFLPKVDGVTRTLARLLEHLEREGHQCLLLGPETGMGSYASHPLVGTAGVPLVVYPGLKLNFLRPKFLRAIKEFQPDVVHFVDPIWLGAQTLMAMELGWAGEEWVSERGPALGAGIRGAVVASYHTNLATYATLFGMAWLEPIMWRFQSWLHSKTLLTLCPSPSTQQMLQNQSFSGVRLWPRGVDLSQFGPSKRCARIRASWGVGDAPAPQNAPDKALPMGVTWQNRKASLPLSPPLSPWTGAVDATAPNPLSSSALNQDLPHRVVLLYIGRISWEKNLHLLLAAYARLAPLLSPTGQAMPKLVFVGDGPARVELEAICRKEGYDATFMGHRSGEELAACYASADVFAFPSFTETFGQVVLEALASGLPVIGLDAEGTRDLVQHEQTGLLLPLPSTHPAVGAPAGSSAERSRTWPLICRDHTSPVFLRCADEYAKLLARAVGDHRARKEMGARASTEGIKGFTWWDAMERCVDGYRESMRTAREKRNVRVITHPRAVDGDEAAPPVSSGRAPGSPRISRVNRVVSNRLAHRGVWPDLASSPSPPAGDDGPEESVIEWKGGKRSGTGLMRIRIGRKDTGETVWHLKTLLKLCMALALFYGVYTHHLAGKEEGSFAAAGQLAM